MTFSVCMDGWPWEFRTIQIAVFNGVCANVRHTSPLRLSLKIERRTMNALESCQSMIQIPEEIIPESSDSKQ